MKKRKAREWYVSVGRDGKVHCVGHEATGFKGCGYKDWMQSTRVREILPKDPSHERGVREFMTKKKYP